METLQAMRERRSVRHYTSKAVEEEKLNAVLESVKLVPSRHNDQNIRCIVVRDPSIKKAIREKAGTQSMVEEADVLLVFVATGALDFVMPCGQYGYTADMYLALGYAILEAADQGLDSCIVCAFDEPAVKEVLGIPGEYRVPCMAVVGYGDDPSPRKVKKELSELVSYDKF